MGHAAVPSTCPLRQRTPRPDIPRELSESPIATRSPTPNRAIRSSSDCRPIARDVRSLRKRAIDNRTAPRERTRNARTKKRRQPASLFETWSPTPGPTPVLGRLRTNGKSTAAARAQERTDFPPSERTPQAGIQDTGKQSTGADQSRQSCASGRARRGIFCALGRA